jgi:hypothetical protein
MPRPTGIYGLPEPYLPSVGQTIYDSDLTALPITHAVRQTWGNDGSPVPSAEAMAALLVAIHDLETAVIALQS